MDLKDKSAGGVIVAAPAGRIDLSNADAFHDALFASLDKAGTTLVLDLSGVDLMTSGGFRVLVMVNREAKARGKRFGIAGPLRELITEVFRIFHAETVFSVFGTVRDAVAKLDPDSLSQLEKRS
jgi:anti-anti-sigma factor